MKGKLLKSIYAAVCLLLITYSFSLSETAAGALNDTKEDKISLDLKGLDIVDALKMLSARANLNIVVGKNVAGRVTIFLKDVNIWDAFEIIIASNNLAYEKDGEIIKVMADRDYELIYGEKFGDKKQFLTRTLKYAKAQDLSATLNQIKSNIGRVIINEAANTLVILDTPAKIAQMAALIWLRASTSFAYCSCKLISSRFSVPINLSVLAFPVGRPIPQSQSFSP